MANTYVLIASNSLNSNTASVTFSSIPQTYTDLLLKISTRNDDTGKTETVLLTVNGLTTAIYSTQYMYSAGTFTGAGRESAQTNINDGIRGNGATATSNTFSNNEIYIPNYTSSDSYKPISVFNAAEHNSTENENWLGVSANLVNTSNAISSITLANTTTKVFVSGSSFFLYGIKNS